MYCILFMANCTSNYFCIEVILQLLFQTALNWKWFIQKLQSEDTKYQSYAQFQKQKNVWNLKWPQHSYALLVWPFCRSSFWVHEPEWLPFHVDHIVGGLRGPSFARYLWLENQRISSLFHHNILFPARETHISCHKIIHGEEKRVEIIYIDTTEFNNLKGISETIIKHRQQYATK